MNILLINHYAGSPRYGMEFRPYYFGREWIERGHQVKVAASTVSHIRARAPQASGRLTREDVDGIEYLWYATLPYQGNGARRLLNMLQFSARLYGLRRDLGNWRPDIVIASSTHPYDVLPAARLARQTGARLVFEVHDLWPLTPRLLGGFKAWHPMIASMQYAEDYAYRHADLTVSMLPCALPYMRERGLDPRRYAHVPNGVPVAEYSSPDFDNPDYLRVREQIRQLREQCDFVLAYAGTHGHANALDMLLQAMARLRDQPIGLLLLGDGPDKPELKRLAGQLGLRNIAFADPVPRPAVQAVMADIDAAYIGLRRSPLFQFGVSPNKLFDYMLSACPVVQSIESGNDIVADAGCGVSVPAEDPAALAAALHGLRALPAAERHAMGRRGRDYVLAHHDYPVLAQQFLDAVQSVTPRRAASR
ncbi:O-antigen biosynthesis protein WlbE [Bordetella genomosp. 6]|uniref:O-antigen biosynthesis protein WlbE n=1 Tax=Bordetella genomosp. 6 TaxID=463024 RepID=UPI000A28EEE7|nr:O-antigen biosynthesis protein WlbE [Bordetella genomosp. 6]ARP78897.1 glycosyltransferase WbuB [Bordetella genomosp. 6]